MRELSVVLDTPDVVASWVERRYPALRALHFGLDWIDRPERRHRLVQRLSPLFSRDRVPVLETIEIQCHIRETAQAVFEALANSDLRPQLKKVYVLRGLQVHAQVEDAAWPSS